MNISPHRIAFIAIVLALSICARPGSGVSADLVDDGSWFTLPGKGMDISISSIGEAYAIGNDGAPLRWDPADQSWRIMSGTFTRITAALERKPWAIDADGDVYRYNGLWWERKDSAVVDVTANAEGETFIAKSDGSIYRWLPLRHSWARLDGMARRLAVDPDGQLWAITPDNTIQTLGEDGWRELPGQAIDIAAGIDQRVATVHPDGRVMLWRKRDRQWSELRGVGNASAIAVTRTGAPWVVTADQGILAKVRIAISSDLNEEEEVRETGADGISAPDAKADDIRADDIAPETITPDQARPSIPRSEPAEASGLLPPPAIVETATGPQAYPSGNDRTERPISDDPSIDPSRRSFVGTLEFTDTNQKADRIAIGHDGSVFGLRGGSIVRWSNQRARFETFPGALVRLAVDPEGLPWGISALGRVFRHTGRDWQQVIGKAASDLAISADGDVVIIGDSGRLFRVEQPGNRFVPIPGRGVAVALDPAGNPWTIRDNGDVWQCDQNNCVPVRQKASSIAIGSDGTVWLVTSDNVLRRKSPGQSDFETVRVNNVIPKRVAAGPQGYPWVIAEDGKVYVSQFFERDEASDQLIAARTSDDLEGRGESTQITSNNVEGFVFTKNMRFETINTDAAPSGNQLKLAIGNDRRVYAYSYSGGQTQSGEMFVFDERRNRFVAEATRYGDQNINISSFDVAGNGDIWAHVASPSVGLFRERNRTHQEFGVSGLTIAGVSVAPDDTVYAIFYTGGDYWLYTKPTTSNSFSRFSTFNSLYDVSVGPGGDVWIVDRDLYVRQWTGSQFQRRPRQGQKAVAIQVANNGEVFIRSTDNDLLRWNATNKSFDLVKDARSENFDVNEDGRPWLSVDSTPLVKRARE